ncbi:Putative peptidoglycan binding domain-containing protein [Roseovarius marisflavi]|uniref:Putative peptidoglycan binding domain-containing protein n=1 Tax=Roseovarius marisflavi TaxID=1054996 RepID=A0A1M6YN07_9RHOB|nr:serine protease [Roseovarius marisflavi]SHL19684.1 Putative peptidoglycan binding domain-containing protein [Roseovarius marisflavi]
MTRYFLGFMLTILLCAPAAWSQDEPLVWVQIEAQPSLAEAQASARRYGADLQDVNGFSLGRGWYGIALGPYRRDEAERVLQVYRNEGVIARDSYIAESSDFQRQFWPVGANLLTRTEPAVPQPLAQAPETAAAPDPAAPDETPREARASEARLDRDGRAALQIALKWAGFYGGAIDAAFGQGTRASMGRWQEANNFEVTGILTTAQRRELLRQYNAVLEGLGLEMVRDTATGIAVKLPMGVVEFDRYEPPFAHFKSKGDIDARVLLISQEGDRNTLAGLYDVMQTLEIVPKTGPRNLERDSFRLIGEGALQISQTEVWLRDGQIKGFTLIWPAGDEERRSRLLGQMQDSFDWLSGTLDPTAGNTAEQRIDLISGLEVRKPRLSRSGFYADQDGAVLTTSEVVQNCGRITIDDMYDAAISLDDAGLGIALLRPTERLAPQNVATFQDLTPRLMSEIAVAGYSYGGILGAPTMTFGQLADLRGLNGEEHLKRLAITALDGDAGGPVLDAGGAVLGMLLPHVQNGRALPEGVSFAADTGALRQVLLQNGITPRITAELGDIPAEALTNRAGAMTVLVSCWE